MGRKDTYSEDTANEIIDRMCNCETLPDICADLGVKISTVFSWMNKHSDFAEMYARARYIRADIFAEEINHVSATPMLGKKTKYLANGDEEITEGDMVEHRRLRVDSLKWMAARMSPKNWGDKLELDNKHSGSVDVRAIERVIIDGDATE